MTAASDDFLEGRGIPVPLTDVETALEKLWGPAAEKAGGPELDHPSVTRIALANIVLVDLGPITTRLDATIEAIAAHYPSRILVLRIAKRRDRRVQAHVAAQCHLPTPGRPQVCSEQIILHAAADALDMLPGAVRSLLAADLKTVLWWSDDLGNAPELLGQLAEGVDRIILDRPDPCDDPAALIEAIDLDGFPISHDIAWFGLTPWRSLIARLFDPPAIGSFTAIDRITITADAESAAQPPRAAIWLSAWFAGQLGWTPDQLNSGPGFIDAQFNGPQGPIQVRLESNEAKVGPFARIKSLSIGFRTDSAGSMTRSVLLQRSGEQHCEVHVGNDEAHSLPRLVLAPEYDAASRLAAALDTDRHDRPYIRAVPIARWLLRLS